MKKNKQKSKQKLSTLPDHLISLYNFDPKQDEIPSSSNGAISEAQPDVSVLLEFAKGDKLLVLSKELDWWLLCKAPRTGQEGYVLSTLTAPLGDRYDSQKI